MKYGFIVKDNFSAVLRCSMHISCTPVNTLLSMFATEPLCFYFDHVFKAKISQITTYCSCRNWFWQPSIQVQCNFSSTKTSIITPDVEYHELEFFWTICSLQVIVLTNFIVFFDGILYTMSRNVELP